MSFFRDYYIGVTEKYTFVQVRSDLIYTLLMYLGNDDVEDKKKDFFSHIRFGIFGFFNVGGTSYMVSPITTYIIIWLLWTAKVG